MANKRMMHECFFQSEDVAEWNIQQRYLVIGIISIADDQGRLRANTKWLRSKLFTYDDVTPAEIKKDLEHIAKTNDTLTIYKVDGKEYIQLTNWWEYQSMGWAKPSEYPAPPEWNDRIRQNIYIPKQWVMTAGWPGVDDCLSYEQALDNRQTRKLGSELGSEQPIFNTNVNFNDSVKASDVDLPKTPYTILLDAFEKESGTYSGGNLKQRDNEALVRLVKSECEPEDVIGAIKYNRSKGFPVVGVASVENGAIIERDKRLGRTATVNRSDTPTARTQ